MSTFFMLVGVPGSGKTTWAKKQNDVVAISTDDIIETIGQKYDLTYNDMFDSETYAFAEAVAYKVAKISFSQNQKVIWDQTNLTAKSRARKLDIVPAHYKKVCVVFGVPSDLQERLQSRVGKHIPENVLKNMMKSFQYPKMDEGFDVILYV